MKAVRIRQHGGPEVLTYEDAPEPKIRADEVLLKVKACALNHLDLHVRGGLPGLTLDMPHILGSDAAGEVVEVGGVCGTTKPGDRVLLAPGVSCRRCQECVSGRDNFCRAYHLFGYLRPGVNAEYIAVPEVNAIPIPGDLTFEEAAAVPLAFLTAWHMLVGVAKIKMGEDVLVIGASSGVGSAAVQIAKLYRCRVIATAGGEAKLEKARELGADEVIDHYDQDVRKEVRRLHRKARRRHRLRTRRISDLAPLDRLTSPPWTPGHLRGHDRRRGQSQPPPPFFQAPQLAGVLHGDARGTP